ncbi:DUF7504 family protein [Halosimplex salinum]|uniref:DUF7504 family protein n=1 Tax=Halosimplex salinum TaxID=1710538 RepID=UPI000F47A87C|nr:hypothetical protein [Halosimplex salinum]
MTENPDRSAGREPEHIDALPQGLATGSTVLVASTGHPPRHDIALRILARLGDADDTILAVTTTESADEFVEAVDRVYGDGERPPLGVVDTVSTGQSVASRYGEVPVVFTPSPSDLERLVVALAELSGDRPPADGARHLLVGSLTPVLDSISTEQVCTVLRQISGIRTDDGLTLVGVDYTAHDEATTTALTEQVDGVLWVTPDADGRLDLEYRPATGRFAGVSSSEQ